MGTLYLVATPIGNLEDITERALRILREVRLIAAEDTRQTRKLLQHYGIHTPLTSFHEHNQQAKVGGVLRALEEGDVALVSDAGTPGLNDPGVVLVRAAIQAGHKVCPIPGPSAPIAALVVSGLPTEAFLYLGYLPRRTSERRALLQKVAPLPYTLIFLEAPHRLLPSLRDLAEVLGDRDIAVARELTKVHEDIFRGRLNQAIQHFEANPPRGELTLVVAGVVEQPQRWSPEYLQSALEEALAQGIPPSQVAAKLAQTSGWQRRDIYQLIQRRKNMNLDDPSIYARYDTQGMLSEITDLPAQLQRAWELGRQLPLPNWQSIEQVVIAGMGGSAIGADLLIAYALPFCPIPIVTLRNYLLPAWAKGNRTLVIASSHSGNTEETLACFENALANDCRILTITTGGELSRAALQANMPLWQFEHPGQPRAAVGYSFGLLLMAFIRLGLIPEPTEEMEETLRILRAQQETLGAEVPVVRNPAKRLAGQLLNRWVTVIGADILEPVARRWKGQINELAKAWAEFEAIPESDHNTLAGLINPEMLLTHSMVLFLRAPSYHARNLLRINLTQKAFMKEGLNTDFVDAKGTSRLAHLWSVLHFGDYTAYYLAMAYGVDPTPVETIEGFKKEMKAAG